MSPPAFSQGKWKTLIEWFRWSLTSLDVNLPLSRIEALAVDVYTAMGGSLRRFHTLDHVFEFSPQDPVETLAVLYHDVVYWSLDEAWPPGFGVLGTVASGGGAGTVLATTTSIPFYPDVLGLFGLRPGDSAKSGSNELFSALAFASALGEDLGRDRTLAVVACIEATVPFRGAGARIALRDRLVALGWGPQQVESAMVRAVRMANQDVGSFRHPDSGTFLGGTWNLLPELNPDLRITAVFTIQAYRRALEAMDRFFAFLTPDLLYDSWGPEPGDATLADWKEQAARNLGIARGYLGAKLASSALLEAFALATGGDAPLSLFMGAASDGDGLEALLPPAPPGKVDPVFFLLEWGRSTKASFDLTNSPLASWIYRQQDPSDRTRLQPKMADFFGGRLDALEFLALWDPSLVSALGRSLAEFVPTRREALVALISRL